MRTELYIGGAWRQGHGERFASHDPATGDKVWEGRAANDRRCRRSDGRRAAGVSGLVAPSGGGARRHRARVRQGDRKARRRDRAHDQPRNGQGRLGRQGRSPGDDRQDRDLDPRPSRARRRARRESGVRRDDALASRARRARRVRAVQLSRPSAQRPHRARAARRQLRAVQAERTDARRRRADGGGVGRSGLARGRAQSAARRARNRRGAARLRMASTACSSPARRKPAR